MIFKILLYAFLFYVLYRLVFHFILPIYRTTQQVKRGFREMNERMNQQYGAGRPDQQASAQKEKEDPDQLGEYIDFEEVK